MNNKINCKYVLNKIFTGSFLDYNLGHEIINFIEMDDKNRYIYINPWGERGQATIENTKYVFHVMGTTYKNQKYYELVAVSEVAKDDVGYNYKVEDERNDLSFKKVSIRKVFKYNNYDKKSHLCTFKAAAFYKPSKRILLLTGRNETKVVEDTDKILIVWLNCNPVHNRAYSREMDIKILDKVVKDNLKLSNETQTWEQYEDELNYSIICDRVKLENSTSNQIAYFFNRDKKLMNLFIKKFLGIDVKDNFSIIREKEEIDLLIEGENNIIVVENKIDSGINNEQLKKYETYIQEHYPNRNAYFYILEPQYSSITEEEKNKHGGKNYKIVYYDDLYKIICSSKYEPNGKSSNYGNFLYKEFIYSIEYIQMSKALQQQKIAYTRLKQRINELKANSKLL